MKIREIVRLLDATVHCGEDLLDSEVESGCGCDMMSDVLAFVKDHSVLLTGLINPQVIRTAEMMDITCVILVRGKSPTDTMVNLAQERGIALMSTEKPMFGACGILFGAGIKDGGVS
jgi:predicted transcriptional regulator